MRFFNSIRNFLGLGEETKDTSPVLTNTQQEQTKIMMRDVIWDDAKPPVKKAFNVLVLADGHGHIRREDLQDTDRIPDAIFLLGDNDYDDIQELKRFIDEYRYTAPIFGIEGNHDKKGFLEREGIQNLHNKTIEFEGLIIGGLSGSIRYTEKMNYCMLSNGESEALMSQMPYCDILLTHDKPCFEKPERTDAHSGLTGIGSYIMYHHPSLVLHGHLHEPYIRQYENTVIRCCYGIECFTISI